MRDSMLACIKPILHNIFPGPGVCRSIWFQKSWYQHRLAKMEGCRLLPFINLQEDAVLLPSRDIQLVAEQTQYNFLTHATYMRQWIGSSLVR